MSAPLESESSQAASGEGSSAGPAGLAPGQRNVVAGRYRLVEFIAEGGMGSVFRAEHVLSRKKLALKVVHPYLCKGRQGVERFRREVSAAAMIDHPGIVQVYDAGVDDDGGLFMAMELLKGESLGDLLRREWPGLRRSVAIVSGMLEPLAKAHAKGFVHRDLKPDNIFLAVDEEGRERVKLLDFGLAREMAKGGPTRTGVTFGTPEYMSPEQAISARQVQPPGDVWSAAVMLYELTSGAHPFSGETPNAIMANAIKEPLRPLAETAPHVPLALRRFIERCLHKEPEKRPADAGQMLAELRAVLEQVALAESVPSAPVAPPRWSLEADDAEALSTSGSAATLPERSGSVAKPAAVHPAEERRAEEDESRLRRRALHAVRGTGMSAPRAEEMPSSERRASYARRDTSVTAPSEESALRPEEEPSSKRRTLLVAGLAAALAGLAGIAGVLIVLSATVPSEEGAALPARSSAVLSAGEPPSIESAPPPGESFEEEEGPSVSAEVIADAPAGADEAAGQRAKAPARRAPRRALPRQETGSSALEEARACLAQNDRRCAKRVLEARARTIAEQALLIDTYRSLGEIGSMLDRMERFVRRYPNAAQSTAYREDLRRYGRAVR